MIIIPQMPTPEQAFKPYKELVQDFDQAVPMLLWCARDQITSVSLNGSGLSDDEYHSLGELLGLAVPDLIQRLGPPHWTIISSESWVRTVSAEEAAALRPGDVSIAAQEGDPGVEEAVVMIGVSTTAEWAALRTFTRTRHRVRWGEFHIEARADGEVADQLKHAVR